MDAKHEVAVAYQTTSASATDGPTLPALVFQVQEVLSPGRMQTVTYDEAVDDREVHQVRAGAQIRQVIETRHPWKDDPERLLPGHDGTSNVVHNEAGMLYWYDRTTAIPVKRRMAYTGYELQGQTIKYRCPAWHEGRTC